MRKFIIIALAVVAMFTAASCTSSNGTPELVYNVTAAATGKVNFSWFNGGASIDGAARICQSNDTTKTVVLTAFAQSKALDLNETLMSNSTDANTLKAATVVRSYVDGIITDVNGVSGEWAVDLTGYVAYGQIVFAIDEHWPKKAEPTPPTE